MKTKLLLALLNTNLKTIGVQFKDHNGQPFGKVYTYKTDIKELEVGDEVVVDAPSTGLTVVVVAEVHDIADLDEKATFEYKWIVCKVDTEAHKARLEKEDELAKEFAVIQRKVKQVKMIENLKASLGYGKDDECEELEALIQKITAQ
ncbi:hypothetical protein [Vibrio phage vB_VnaS-AQKL99]|nr:hypothetical protein [Vibrio phage vB_VnaS-AQKL99]